MIRYDSIERNFDEFFIYASCCWLEHFSVIKVESLSSLTSIETLCQANSTRLHNWIKQICHSNCAIKLKFEFDNKLYDSLSIISLYDSKVMLRYMLENSNFEKNKFLHQSTKEVVDQILRWENLTRLKILLLKNKFNYQLRNLDFFRHIVRQWFHSFMRHHNWNLVFDFIDNFSNILIEKHCVNELLCIVVKASYMLII